MFVHDVSATVSVQFVLVPLPHGTYVMGTIVPFVRRTVPPPPVVHLPPEQRLPDGHTLPHEPQFALSLSESTQYAPASPLQSVCVPPHALVHVPATHESSGFEHGFPHAPQFALSVCKSAQYAAPPSPPHCVCDPLYVFWQTPLTQICPLVHALPHWPQLLSSAASVAQYGAPASPPHSVSPLLLSPHVPLHCAP
jgi:hypothetical protein